MLRLHYLIGNETGAAKATRATQPMHPFGPLRIEPTIGLLIFGLEHTDRFSIAVLDKIRAGTALVDAKWINARFDGKFGLSYHVRKLGVI